MPDKAYPVASDTSHNIVIFSDGTGQRGGLYFDEERTNVYKLYRATRVAPDSTIDPDKQVAFYDPGLGTLPEGGNTFQRTYRKIFNFVSQATGLGITSNIIDCYAAIIRLWRPGDHIFLFGFSRGAYTVRCVASVVCLCGIPTVGRGGRPLHLDKGSSTWLASRAVKSVYKHVSSPRDEKYVPQRKVLAAAFREKYHSNDPLNATLPNAYPHFVGVFDTVASLTNTGSLLILFVVYLMLHILLAIGLSSQFPLNSVGYWFGWISVWTICGSTAAYIYTHLKFAWRIPGYFFWDTIHLTTFRQKFYDQQLSSLVRYARHAISIDEGRNDFKRVPWGGSQSVSDSVFRKVPAFKQLWFSGNHADVGGGYAESESRLSDISLAWMIGEASHPKLGPEKLLVDEQILSPSGRTDGMQHDETRSALFRWAKKTFREPVPDATLHPSVLQRFDLEKVQQYDVVAPYRPEALRRHTQVQGHYTNIPLPRITCWQRLEMVYGRTKRNAGKAFDNWIGGIVYSLYPAGWKAKRDMESESKQFSLDSLASCLGLACLMFFVGAGAWIFFFWQIFPWLREGIWYSYPLAAYYFPVTGWVGLDIILNWISALPVTLLLVVMGVFLFWLFGLLSTKLYVWASKGANKTVTPAQVHN